MTSKPADGVADDVGRRRRRKVRARAGVRERSLTPEARESKIMSNATKVPTKTTPAILQHKKISVQPKQAEVVKEKNTAGLVDDGWGGLVEETVLKYRAKVEENVEADTNVEQNTAKANVETYYNVENDAKQVNDAGYNMSEMNGTGNYEVPEVRKRTVVEDRLEKLKFQNREYNDQLSGGSRGGYERRGTMTNVRRRGRGRIVCLDWQKGRCTYGSSCKFLHDEDAGYNVVRSDRRSPEGSPRSRGVCFDWQNGRCRRGSSCRFAHHGSKRDRGPDICFDFTRGRCHRGETCKFSHETAKVEACFDYKNGRCFRGEQCRFSHEYQDEGFVERRRSRGVCFDWQKGICRRGYSCRFDHEEGSSQNNSYDSIGTGRQSNRADWFEDDYELDHTGERNVASGEVEYEDVGQNDKSYVAAGYHRKKIIKERYQDDYHSKGNVNDN